MENNNKKPVFNSPFKDFENMDINNDNTSEIYNKIAKSGDERSKIILAGIITEYYLDRLLKKFFVDYKFLEKRNDYTFSFKIALLKSIRFIPHDILVICDCVRNIRNKFAHNLEIDNIENIDAKNLQKQINQLFRENFPNIENKKLIEKFEIIFKKSIYDLRSFEMNLVMLREKIDDENFEKELNVINHNRMFEFHEKLIKKNKPLEIIKLKNGDTEIKYSKSFSVIKKIR